MFNIFNFSSILNFIFFQINNKHQKSDKTHENIS